MVRAAQAISQKAVELIYLNDGPIPADRLRVMRETGEVIAKSRLGNSGSLRAAFSLPTERAWNPDDLVWFAEDDYLYLPNALADLVAAKEAYTNADYFSLYALIGNRLPNGSPSEDKRVPENWQSDSPRKIKGSIWRKALSTTSTFGARVRTVKEDRGMMLAAMRCGGAFDHSTCLAYQGFTPYPLWFLAQGVWGATRPIPVARSLAASLVRAGFNVYAAARSMKRSPRFLVASDPALITHLESAFLADGVDWAAVAADTQLWVAAGLTTDSR